MFWEFYHQMYLVKECRLHVMSDCIQNVFKNGGHQRRKRRAGWDRAEREKASSHLGDIRSVLCEQSRPTGEQSWSLELGYYRLVGPCVWKCTCRRAGLWLWRLTGGGGEEDFGPPVCQLSVSLRPVFHSCSFLTLFLCVSAHCENTSITHVSPLIFYLLLSSFFLFAVSFFLFSSDHHHYTSASPHVVLHSSPPPSFKCWWAAEQYPGGHGDRQPPPCGLFLPLSVDPLLLGSPHSINRTHTGLITSARCAPLASIMGDTLETWEHAWRQDTWGNLWLNPQRNSIKVPEWPHRLNLPPYEWWKKHVNMYKQTGLSKYIAMQVLNHYKQVMMANLILYLFSFFLLLNYGTHIHTWNTICSYIFHKSSLFLFKEHWQ